MVKHQRPACRVCGTPLITPDELHSLVCDTCDEWSATAGESLQAIDYAERERLLAEQERWKQRRKAR